MARQHTLSIASHNGDDKFTFDPDNVEEVNKAMEKFHDLVNNKKYFAATPGKSGAPGEVVRSFDKEREDVLLFPQRIGG